MLSRALYKTVNLLIKCSWSQLQAELAHCESLPQYAAGSGYLCSANLSDISSKDGKILLAAAAAALSAVAFHI